MSDPTTGDRGPACTECGEPTWYNPEDDVFECNNGHKHPAAPYGRDAKGEPFQLISSEIIGGKGNPLKSEHINSKMHFL